MRPHRTDRHPPGPPAATAPPAVPVVPVPSAAAVPSAVSAVSGLPAVPAVRAVPVVCVVPGAVCRCGVGPAGPVLCGCGGTLPRRSPYPLQKRFDEEGRGPVRRVTAVGAGARGSG
jgi:hypothetical protein